ncbi:MAG: hypothetical protein IKN30_03615, partial [Synergistaceae bacterium]|nr:hypothetical protein [Synergistaceae bacterium]
GAVIGAGAASVAGAALLGPVGLVSGVFIRGNSLKIRVGSVTFVQTSGDCTVSAYPIPISLQKAENNITSSMPGENSQQQGISYNPDKDTIIKRDVFNRNAYGEPTNSGTVNNGGGNFELPPEQSIN